MILLVRDIKAYSDRSSSCVAAPRARETVAFRRLFVLVCATIAGLSVTPQLARSAIDCDVRPRLAYQVDEAARIQDFATQMSTGSVGLSRAQALEQMLASGTARTFDSNDIPTAAPAIKGEARDAALAVLERVEWASFLRHIGNDDRHVAIAAEGVLRIARWNDWTNNDLSLSDLTMATAKAIDALCPVFSASELDELVSAVENFGIGFYTAEDASRLAGTSANGSPLRVGASPNHKISNAASWATTALVLEGDHPDASVWLSRALFYAREGLADAGAGDGGAVEGLSYGLVSQIFLGGFDLDLERLAGVDLSTEFSGWIAEFPNYIQHHALTGGTALSLNDSGATALSAAPTAFLRAAAAVPGTPPGRRAQGLLGRYLASAGGFPTTTPQDLRYFDPDLLTEDPLSTPLASFFPSVGQAFARTSWFESDEMVLAIKAQPQPSSGVTAHIHYDAGSLVLNWAGQTLLGDPGYAVQAFVDGLVDPDTILPACVPRPDFETLNLFTLRTPGHNTLTLEDAAGNLVTQQSLDASLDRFESQGQSFFADADFTNAYREASATPPMLLRGGRRIAGALPHAILVVDDVASSGGPMTASFRMNAFSGGASGILPPLIQSLGSNAALFTAANNDRRIRVQASGDVPVSVQGESFPDLDCLGEQLVVKNSNLATAFQMATLLLPEHVGDSAPTVIETSDLDSFGFEIVRGALTTRIRIARSNRTFSSVASGTLQTELVSEVVVDDGTGGQVFAVPEPATGQAIAILTMGLVFVARRRV